MNQKPLESYPLFPVPFFRIDYDDAHNFHDVACDVIYRMEKEDQTDLNDRYTANSYTSFYSNDSVIDIPEFKNFKNFVYESIHKVNENVGLHTDFTIPTSWASINRKYSYHETHTHLPNLWSGVYYVKATEEDATISFLNKNIIDLGWPYSAIKNNNSELVNNQVTCQVTTGMMIIFPSYLPHKVDQQKSDTDRINIAFNVSIPL